jgi:tetratricopeptide (TPR) repeat protein
MFGYLLITMNEDAKAEAYFRMLLKDLPKTHDDLASVYDYIGELNMRTTNWKEALKNFELANEMKRKKRSWWNHPDFERTLNNIGNYYMAIEDHTQAHEYYTKALQYTTNPTYRTIIHLNISSIYELNKDYGTALNLCFEARENLHQTDPYAYVQMIHCLGKIGHIYLSQKIYDVAEGFYLTAFEISERFLVPGDRLQTCCIEALIDLYNEQNLKQKSIDFCLNTLYIYQRDLPENHLAIGHLLMKIGESYQDSDDRKIDSLQKALVILERNIHLDYITTANCLLMIATYFQKQKKNMEAAKYLIRAHEIQTEIYPKNHTKVYQTRHNVNV